jgi:hypothetical protein
MFRWIYLLVLLFLALPCFALQYQTQVISVNRWEIKTELTITNTNSYAQTLNFNYGQWYDLLFDGVCYAQGNFPVMTSVTIPANSSITVENDFPCYMYSDLGHGLPEGAHTVQAGILGSSMTNFLPVGNIVSINIQPVYAGIQFAANATMVSPDSVSFAFSMTNTGNTDFYHNYVRIYLYMDNLLINHPPMPESPVLLLHPGETFGTTISHYPDNPLQFGIHPVRFEIAQFSAETPYQCIPSFPVTIVDPSGVEENQLSPSGIRIYPNPCLDHITVSIQDKQLRIAQAAIYNLKGNLIKKIDADDVITWDCKDAAGRNVADGVYLLRMQSGSKQLVRKFIILGKGLHRR